MDAESKLCTITAEVINTWFQEKGTVLKRRRVNFEPEALRMSRKHEERPSTRKLTEFRETIEIGSASSWRKFNLELFHVEYKRDEYDCLPMETQEYHNVDETSPFGKRYSALIAASNQVAYDDLLAIRSDEVEEKLDGNLLTRTLENLGRIMNQRSPESAAREAAKLQEAREAKAAYKSITPSPSKQIMISKHDTADSTLSRHPTTLPSTPQKRTISDTSFGTRSTESTPTKLVKPETDIQQLQNDLVGDVLSALYGKVHVKVRWPKGRKLNLSNSTSFPCRLMDNNTEKFDRVRAISDGALYLETNKRSNPDAYCRWSRQSACLSFEAKKLDATLDQIKSSGEAYIAEAEAEARAAQILAEMLGVVCHEDYYKYGDQMAFVVHLSGLKASIYWSLFPQTYLHTIHKLGVAELSTGIKLCHTQPQSLIHHEQRTTFLREMIVIIRFLADGKGNVGLLRRIPETPIHRDVMDRLATITYEGAAPPQKALDASELMSWMNDNDREYEP